MDAFYASVEQQRHPELRGQPVVVGHSGPRGVVAAASYEARRFGVHSAMPSATARRLCPQAIFVPADFATYGAVSARMFGVLRGYTPLVEPLSLDEAFLDLTADPGARRDPAGVAARLKADVLAATGGLTASVGVATCKVVAKIASDLRKPDGLVVVAPGEEQSFLAPLPIRTLPGLGPATERRLDGLGLTRIGDIGALPVDVLTARLGSHGAALRDLALGIDPRPVVLPGRPKSISREVTFERDIADRGRLRQVARDLAHDVGASLRRQHLVSRTVRLKLRFSDFDTHTAQTTLEEATDIDAELAAAAESLLAAAGRDPRAVRLLGVGAASLRDAQADLLVDTARERRRALDQSVDALRRRFGAAAVRQGAGGPRRQLDWRREDVEAAALGDAEA